MNKYTVQLVFGGAIEIIATEEQIKTIRLLIAQKSGSSCLLNGRRYPIKQIVSIEEV